MKEQLNRNFYYFLALFFIFISIPFFYHQCNKIPNTSQRDFPEIATSNNLKFVTEYNTVDYYVIEDTIQGLQNELIEYIKEKSGLNTKIFLENNLETSILKLENKEYDIIARNIPVTEELKKKLAFTIPIFKDKQVLVQRKKTNEDSTAFISNQIELAHKTIYIPSGSPSILRLKNMAEEIAEPIFIQEIPDYTSEQLLYMVAYKEIDYAVIDQNTAINNVKIFSNIDISTDIGFNQLQSWAVRKDSPLLLDSLNNWIEEFLQNNRGYLQKK
ncbi:transporter substrate-binding domain-containing protein [Bacteroidales bacterium OttesenSCG-928-M06]|nr:transporter substrate-binding domain-containing protein [Bacteroidales bacterium OttesenSCG-928-M06]